MGLPRMGQSTRQPVRPGAAKLPSLYGAIDREMILAQRAQPKSIRSVGYKPHQGPRELARRRKRMAIAAQTVE